MEVYYWQRVADRDRRQPSRRLARPRLPRASPSSTAIRCPRRRRRRSRRRRTAPPPARTPLGSPRRSAASPTPCSAGSAGTGCRWRSSVEAGEVGPEGVELVIPESVRPEGGRRAGLTAHEFMPRMIGQEQHIYTGWLDVDGDRAVYAPHTRAGYKLPASKIAVHPRRPAAEPAPGSARPARRVSLLDNCATRSPLGCSTARHAQLYRAGCSRIFSSGVPGGGAPRSTRTCSRADGAR